MRTEGKLRWDGDYSHWDTPSPYCKLYGPNTEQVASLITNEANAKRLALCWNEHDELVAALRFIVEQIDAPENSAHTLSDYRYGAGMSTARALLAKPTEGK